MKTFQSTKVIELGSTAFRQWKAKDCRSDGSSKCHLVHGYYLTAKFTFSCNKLDDKNWCLDFGSLKAFKSFLETQFDHTTCIAENDPLLSDFKALHEKGGCDLRVFKNGVGIERFAEYCLVNANAHIDELTQGRCWCSQVEVWEHNKNSALCIYTPREKKIKKDKDVLLVEESDFNPEFKNSSTIFDKSTNTFSITPDLTLATKETEGTFSVKPPEPSRAAPVGPLVEHKQPEMSKAAPVGPVASTPGWSDPFAGTSWGRKR